MHRVHLVFAVLALLIASPLAAQSNELGGFISISEFESVDLSDPDFPDQDASLDFDSDIGYGISFNRYWTPAFSTEFAAQQLNSNAEVSFSDGDVDVEVDAGNVDVQVFSAIAQLHFGTGALVPYVGAGVALLNGSIDVPEDFRDPGDPATVDFESETTWVANGGIDFRLGPSFAIGADVKYIPYEAVEEDSEEDGVDLNPLIISAVVKFRF